VNRRHGRPIWVYALGFVVLGAAGYLCFELGRYEAGYSLLDQRHESEGYKQRLQNAEAENEQLRRKIAILETSGEIDKETYSQVEATLADLQSRIQAQEEELVFYRGIVSPQDGVPGLRIQSLQVLPTDQERRYTLRLTLVQAIVHNRRVSGTVRLQLDGTRDGQTASYEVGDLAPADSGYDMSYAFRYFQGLEAEFELPVGFEPQRVEVEIVPSESRADHISQSYEWSAVTH
jgi:Family of unknown function (DUF6776)